MVFCFVIEITEKVDAGEGLQFADIGHVRTQHIVALIVLGVVGILVLMFYPEGHGLVAAFVLAKNGHEEILGYNQTIG